MILYRLAVFFQEQGQTDQAEQRYQQALRVQAHHLGSEHPLTKRTRIAYASLLRTLGRTTEAMALEADDPTD